MLPFDMLLFILLFDMFEFIILPFDIFELDMLLLLIEPLFDIFEFDILLLFIEPLFDVLEFIVVEFDVFEFIILVFVLLALVFVLAESPQANPNAATAKSADKATVFLIKKISPVCFKG